MTTRPEARVEVRSPGRVNLIGDHTDYTGGLVLPMAIDRYTTLIGTSGGNRVRLRSDAEPDPVDLPLHLDDPSTVTPHWGRYVAGVVAEVAPSSGLEGAVHTTIPVGAGLSSSAALETAVALALGVGGDARTVAELCRRAEIRASGVPCGIMDQLSIAAGVDGHALLIDCQSLEIAVVPVPDDLDVVVWFVTHRTLVGSAYADRVAECAAAEREIGPLRLASIGDTASIGDELVRARARHVVTENERVRAFAAALAADDRRELGRLMLEGHRSLATRFATSTPTMDDAVAHLASQPGVHGARMTGGGFGGCVVALAEPGSIAPADDRWIVRPVGGAARIS
ncbi:MAG: galactokinase [Ilumatobacteraceae bacterium]